MVFSALSRDEHEQVSYFHDEATGLRAIIAIHDTRLGPALGGTRIWDYDTEEDALRDALLLSRGMSYKAAASDIDLGGGKAVIMGDPEELRTERALRTYGRMVESLNGRYITSHDVNTSEEDMNIIQKETEYVVGVSEGLGDASSTTAHGVFHGIRGCLEASNGDSSVDGVRVVVQGVGNVGRALAKKLTENGAEVIVSDVDESSVDSARRELGVETVEPENVYETPCDVLSPCALGGVINNDTVERLECDIVAGSANNQLERHEHAEALQQRGILYAPDYVVNSGGLYQVFEEFRGGDKERALKRAERIQDRIQTIIEEAREAGETTLAVSDEYAERRMEELGCLHPRTLSSSGAAH